MWPKNSFIHLSDDFFSLETSPGLSAKTGRWLQTISCG